jgi:hypothetical protein
MKTRMRTALPNRYNQPTQIVVKPTASAVSLVLLDECAVFTHKSCPGWRISGAVRTAVHVVAVVAPLQISVLSASRFRAAMDLSISRGTTNSLISYASKLFPVTGGGELTESASPTPCEPALPSTAFRYFAGTQPLQHGDHRQQLDVGPEGLASSYRVKLKFNGGSEMALRAVLSISLFLLITVWVTPENQPAELSRLFCFQGTIFGVPKSGALSQSRVMIDPGTMGSRNRKKPPFPSSRTLQ